jgi:tight adherence protein C
VVIAAALAFAAATLGVLGVLWLIPVEARSRAVGGPRTLRALVALGARAAAGRGTPRDLERRILAAGRPGGFGPRELMAAKLAAAVLGGLAGALVAGMAPGRLGVLVTVAAPGAGFLAPDVWMARRAREREQAVRRVLPAMLDLLRVTVEAGASLPAALSQVGGRSSGPLASEWRAVGREVELGVPLSEALEALTERLPQSEVRALCAALERARRHGAPLGRTLAGQARDTRVALRRHVQEEAAKAGPKIQLVVALLLVPSVLLMVAAALAAALLGSGGLPAV